MSKPVFTGTYTLVSSDNEDNFLKAQGLGWVMRQAAKQIGKRVVIEHEGDFINIKAGGGIVDVSYEIGAPPVLTTAMGFEFDDACEWQGETLKQTKLFKDGSKVETVRSLSADRQSLTYRSKWIHPKQEREVSSIQNFQRVSHPADAAETPASQGAASSGLSKEIQARMHELKANRECERPTAAEVRQEHAGDSEDTADTAAKSSGWASVLHGFVTKYEESDEEFFDAEEGPALSQDEWLGQLLETKAGLLPYKLDDEDASRTSSDGKSDATHGQNHEGEQQAKDTKLMWMWADAGVSQKLAQMNPFRWSSKMSPSEMRAAMQKQNGNRAVRIVVIGQKHALVFPTPSEASIWLQGAMSESAVANQQARQSGAIRKLGLSGLRMLVNPAFIVYFLRRHARTSWKQKNVFMASMYARRITQLPHVVSSMQQHKDPSEAQTQASPHPLKEASYEQFAASPVYQQLAFITAASMPMGQREPQLQVGSRTWICIDSSKYWMAWVAMGDESECECVLAFRGSDGSVEDACDHPGSAVRAFINGESESKPPELPFDLLRTLSQRVSEVGHGGMSLIGYSQGGIAALACAMWLGGGVEAGCSELDTDTLTTVNLLNCTTMFWPTWFSSLLSADWWQNPPKVSSKVTSWVIKDDPLSEGISGARGYRAPRTPGTTLLLPSKFQGKELIKNHSLSNYVFEDG